MWKAPLYSTTKVTIELRDIVQNGENSIDIWNGCEKLLHPDYIEKFSMTEDTVREAVTNHFLFRQIGFETVARFLHEWKQRTREISSHYQNITYAQSLLFSQEDPLESYHLIETFNETNEGTSTGSGKSDVTSEGTSNTTEEMSRDATDNNQHLFSDTPQGNIQNVRTHLSNGTIDDNTHNESTSGESGTSSTSESSSTTTSSASAESSINRTLERRGNIGVQPLGDEVHKYQDAFDNILIEIIKEYETLFLRVY